MSARIRRLSYFCLGLWLYLPWEPEAAPREPWQPAAGLRGRLLLEKTITLPSPSPARLEWEVGSAERSLILPWPAVLEKKTLQYFPSSQAATADAHLSIPSLLPDHPKELVLNSGPCRLQQDKDWLFQGASIQLKNLDYNCEPKADQPLELLSLEKLRPQLQLPLDLNDRAAPYRLRVERSEAYGTWTLIPARWDQGQLILDDRDYREGASLRISYSEAVLAPSLLHLPQTFDKRSLAFAAASPSCDREKILFEGRTVEAACRPGESLALAYTFVPDQLWLDASDLLDPLMAEHASWRLRLDGEEELMPLQRVGSRFRILEEGLGVRQLKLEAELRF